MSKNEAKHTPGPWKIERGGGHGRPGIRGSDSIHVNGRKRNSLGISSASYSDLICDIPFNLELPGVRANAHLIAAAPEMLEALKELAQWDTERNYHGEPHKKIVTLARTVIAKAEGGS